jgi:RIP metalloprotease RseP
MTELLDPSAGLLAAIDARGILRSVWLYGQIFFGFSFIIFIHELGHFMVAKWAGVRIEQFAIGFFREVVGFTRGETRYSFNLLPLGGYVKMLGQEDFEVDTTGELQFRDDPRSFANKSVGARMAIVSAGVIMNLILAGFLFMAVFLIGKTVPAARVGMVVPDSPAALAGMQTGDRIVSIDGAEIDEWMDVNMAVILAKPDEPLDVVVERAGKQMVLQVEPVRNPDRDAFHIGISSPHNSTLVAVGPEYSPTDPTNPRVGDKIVEMAGQAVTDDNANAMMNQLLTDPLSNTSVVVERRKELDNPNSPVERVTVQLRPRLALKPIDTRGGAPNLLGMVPLLRVSEITPGGRAELAGLKVGDTIVEWAGIRFPNGRQIDDNITASAQVEKARPERDIPIRVWRGPEQKEVSLVVRPLVRIVPITGKRSAPTIDAKYKMFADDVLLVGSIIDEYNGTPTPAKQAGIAPGTTITQVDGEPIKRWVDLVQQLLAHAGSDVEIAYRSADGKDATAQIHVPQSLQTALQLGPEADVLAIAGQDSVIIDKEGNEQSSTASAEDDAGNGAKRKTMRVSVNHPVGLRAVMAKHVGETVEVKYRKHRLAETQTGQVTVTQEMLYPWVGGVGFTVDAISGGEMTLLRKTNPFAALKVGAKKTYYFVIQVYQVMERLIVTRSLGVETISGPVGIVKLGGAVAERGFTDLLFFLAMISANLAVINFLPLPIVDGGLMVFLLIEKIKGSPISMRVQVATQVIGLILIGSAFVFVTILDVWRL